MLGVYTTASMIGIVASLRSRSAFMLDLGFGNYVGPTGQREIYFDVEDDVLGVAPFVSPLKEGKVVSENGYQTKSFTPAYVKVKMPLNPLGPIYRSAGEDLLGALSPEQREKGRVAKGFDDLIGMHYRRFEMMAIETLKTGKLVVQYEGSEAVEANFGRHADLTATLGGSVEWGDSGVSPVDDLDDWMMDIAAKSGIHPTDVVMDAKAWKLYEADPKFAARRDINLGTLPGSGTLSDPGLSSGVDGGVLKATLSGGKVRIWVYQQIYKHPTTGVVTNMIDDYSVFIVTKDPRATGTRHFGTIIDPELGYDGSALIDPDSGAMMEFAPKTWTVPDPAARFLMVQSAPFTALTRPNTTAFRKVKTV